MGIYWSVGVLPLSGVLRFLMIIFLIFFSAGVTHSMGSTHDGVYRVGLVTPAAISKRRKPSPRVVVSYDSEFQTDLSGDVAPVVPSPDGDFMSLLASITWPVLAASRLPEAAVPLAAQVPPAAQETMPPEGPTPAPSTFASPGLSPARAPSPTLSPPAAKVPRLTCEPMDLTTTPVRQRQPMAAEQSASAVVGGPPGDGGRGVGSLQTWGQTHVGPLAAGSGGPPPRQQGPPVGHSAALPGASGGGLPCPQPAVPGTSGGGLPHLDLGPSLGLAAGGAPMFDTSSNSPVSCFLIYLVA